MMNKLGLSATALVFALLISGAISKPVYAHSLLTVGQIGDAVEVVRATSPDRILLAKGKGKGKGQGKGKSKGANKTKKAGGKKCEGLRGSEQKKCRRENSKGADKGKKKGWFK